MTLSDEGEVIEEVPKFVAFNSCKRWWEEMQSLYEDPKNTEDVDTNQPDEGYDCTRYLSMSRPITPTLKTTQPQGTFQAERKRLIRAKTYSKRHGVSLATAYGNIR